MTDAGPDLSGTRVLVCHSIVHDIIGSTVVTLDLATALRDHGADVTVYATFVGEPASLLFAERGIQVLDDEGLGDLSWRDLDLVWVHSQVLPQRMVEELGEPWPEDGPAFVFLHMSALHYAPDEHPYIHQLEERLSSLSLFVSEQTRDQLLPYYVDPPPHALYPNPTPRAFCASAPEPVEVPRRVLLVTNHADADLLGAREVLRARGLTVRHVGSSGEGQQFVTPELLAEHDVVVTIGKTVQYCLVSGQPVYVYDHFGGYGYLDEGSLPLARRHNFSGRGGERRSSEQIADEILDGYGDAVAFHRDRRDAFIEELAIDRVLARVLDGLEPRRVEPFPPSYVRVVRSAQAFGSRFFHYWGHNANEVRNRRRLESEVEGLGHELARTREDADRRVAALVDELDGVRASWTFRIGRVAMLPVRAARRLRGLLSR